MSSERRRLQAAEILSGRLVIDAHCDTVGHMMRTGYDLSRRHGVGHIDIPRLREAGVKAQFFAAFVPPERQGGEAALTALLKLDALHGEAERDGRFVIARSAADVLEAVNSGRIACILSVEGGHALAGELGMLRTLDRLGVRSLTLTWENSNELADAAAPDQAPFGGIARRGGLTDFGREVVREMNRLGLIVDLSHAHDDTFRQVLELSTRPVMASHSCCRALNPHYRNLSDAMLHALARNGGVMGINFFSAYLSAEYAEAARGLFKRALGKRSELKKRLGGDSASVKREWQRYVGDLRKTLPRVTISLLADHVDHAVAVAGIDHVGLGSDFDGLTAAPEGLEDVTGLPRLVEELLERGYNEADLGKLLGGNLLRLIAANDVRPETDRL